jgi:hypothetical protein
MTFGQLFDRTYRLMRANIRLFLGIAAVPSSAIFVVFAAIIALVFISLGSQISGGVTPPPTILLCLSAILFCASYLIFPLIYALYMPAASYAATQADLGVAVTFREAYAVGWRRFGRYLWLMILCVLYILVPVLACLLVVGLGAILVHFAMSGDSGPLAAFLLFPLGVLLYIALAVYSVLIILRFSLAYPACVVEQLPAWASLRRSVQLTKGAKGRIFLVLLVVYALTYAVSMVCMLAFFAVGALVALVAVLAHVTPDSPAFVPLICLAALGFLVVMIITCMFSYAAFTTALAVLYHDQRLRQDGLLSAPGQATEAQA